MPRRSRPPLKMLKKKCRPSGRNIGFAKSVSWLLKFGAITRSIGPPAADTFESPVPPRLPNRITPSRFHVPPVATPTSASAVDTPPPGSILRSLPAAKYPMNRLSGDQNGSEAPSVPASCLGSRSSIARTHNCIFGPVAAVNASQRPSGDTARWLNAVSFGGEIDNRNGGRSIAAGADNQVRAGSAIAAINTAPAIAMAASTRPERFTAGAVAPVCESDLDCSVPIANARSVAERNRRSGSFSRHRRITFSSAGCTCTRARTADPAAHRCSTARHRFGSRCRARTRDGPTASRTGSRRTQTDPIDDPRASPRTCSGDMYPTVPSTTPLPA